MKNPFLLLLAIAVAVVLWSIAKTADAHHRKGHQFPPLEVLASGHDTVNCGDFYDFREQLRHAWEQDKRLMRKGITSPLFKKDWLKLQYYEELFNMVCEEI